MRDERGARQRRRMTRASSSLARNDPKNTCWKIRPSSSDKTTPKLARTCIHIHKSYALDEHKQQRAQGRYSSCVTGLLQSSRSSSCAQRHAQRCQRASLLRPLHSLPPDAATASRARWPCPVATKENVERSQRGTKRRDADRHWARGTAVITRTRPNS